MTTYLRHRHTHPSTPIVAVGIIEVSSFAIVMVVAVGGETIH